MVSIRESLENAFLFLAKARELREASVLEIGRELEWNYPKTRNVAKALEQLGLIKLEQYRGMPRKFIVKVTTKGECIIACISRSE